MLERGVKHDMSAVASFKAGEEWGPSMEFSTDSGEPLPEGTYNFAYAVNVTRMNKVPLYSKCGVEDETLRVKVEAWLTSEVEESYGTNFVPEELSFKMDLGLSWKEC